MKRKILLFGFLSMLLESLKVSAARTQLGGWEIPQITLPIDFGALKEPNVIALIASTMLVGFILYILAMKVPVFDKNRIYAGIFASLLTVITIMTVPVVAWIMLVGSMGGVIISVLLVFSVLYAMYVTAKKTRVDAKIESGDIDKDYRDSRDEHEDEYKTRRYKKVKSRVKKLVNTIAALARIKDKPDYREQCNNQAGMAEGLKKLVEKAGKQHGKDPTGDGDEARVMLDRCMDELNKRDPNISIARKMANQAFTILDDHEN